MALALISCGPAGSEETPKAIWKPDEIVRLKHWVQVASEDALPVPDTRELDAAIKVADGAGTDRAATALALRLARLQLLGATPIAERTAWHIVDSDESIDLQGRLAQALAKDNIDGFLGGLRPESPDFAVLRAAYATETDPVKRKALALNMDRWRWLPQSLGADYVLVNSASFEASLWHNGKRVGTWPVIVGKPSTPSPVFSARISGVTFNPWWEIPPSIVREKHGRFPARLGYVHAGGRWRQRPGPANSLGVMKLVMANPFNVYLHDTPGKSLFAKDVRAFSHGCIRVGDAVGFATTLLAGNKTREQVDAIIAGGKLTTIGLPTQLPVYITYFTVAVRGNGLLTFEHDIYGRDSRKGLAYDCERGGCSA